MTAPRAMMALGALCAALLVSCSSAPRQPDTVITVKTEGDQAATTGQSYYRQGRYDLALQFFSQALSQYTSVDDGDGIVKAYIGVGRCYTALGQAGEAEGVFLQARDRAREEGAASLLFDARVNLGELYLSQGNPEKARTTLQEESTGQEKGRTPAQNAQLYHDLGTAEKGLGNSAPALEDFNRSLKINLGAKYYAEAAADYYMISSVYSRDGRYDEALTYASQALQYDKRVESSPGIAKDLYALGLISGKKGDTAAAYDWLQRSYNVFVTLGFREDMKRALTALVSAADALGRTAEAEAYRKALADLGSS
ncbi:MAG TPA: tetratricopeptide repeat protein [Spirochaetia bacterium]|nr:tetratricopeptide repeat protein [Spirochaetia bacterium]